MAVANLTGYTWKPNNSVSITSAKTYNIIGNGVSQQGTFETTTFELVRRTQTNEYSGQTEYFVGLYLKGGLFSNFIAGVAYWCNSSGSSSYPSTASTADTEATITFVSGTDTTNTELIAWLEANGTLTKPVVLELVPFLTNIANAIRKKKGTTSPINAQDFASEIESIESGGSALTGYTGSVWLGTTISNSRHLMILIKPDLTIEQISGTGDLSYDITTPVIAVCCTNTVRVGAVALYVDGEGSSVEAGVYEWNSTGDNKLGGYVYTAVFIPNTDNFVATIYDND